MSGRLRIFGGARGSRLVATPAACVALLLAAPPAVAHGQDPTLVPVIDAVTPALPADVVVQVYTGVSEQMLVGNPTATVLTVLDPEGTPFLRLSKSGTFGNVADPFFHRTLNPPDVPPRIPASARDGAKPTWVRLTRGGEFGWFEPRLHPAAPGTETGGPASGTVVSRWDVGMQFGKSPVQVTGSLQRQAVTGSFVPVAEPRSDELRVSVVPGKVPGLLLIAPPERRIVIAGTDGQDFLRLDRTGVFANTLSSNFRDNLDFLDRAGARTGWVKVGEPGRVRWLDRRLQYGADRPPDVVERAGKRAELGRWEIPLTVDGTAAPVLGTLTWIPAGAALTSPDQGTNVLPYAIGGAVVAGVAALAVVGRRRRHAAL